MIDIKKKVNDKAKPISYEAIKNNTTLEEFLTKKEEKKKKKG